MSRISLKKKKYRKAISQDTRRVLYVIHGDKKNSNNYLFHVQSSANSFSRFEFIIFALKHV